LVIAGISNCLVAVLHVAIIFIGAPGYRYFGVPDMAILLEKGSQVPTIVTTFLVIFFSLIAIYAFSCAGLIRKLPLSKTVVATVGSIYLLRGLALVPDSIRLFNGSLKYPRALAFSGVALLIGVTCIVGYVWAIRSANKCNDA
jgi:hypothetical protein